METLVPGDVLAGRYEVQRVLGVGGEGVVVEAVDRRHARRVAVKVRAFDGGSPDEALLSEARVLLGLAPHPALPTVREDLLEPSRYLLVMDWVDGVDLEKVMTDGPVSPGLAMVLLQQVAGALDHLHAHGVVHGDVKPANVLLLPGSRAQLVDLGLAAASITVGSPGYAAPEREEQRTPTAAGDVYGLAATALALLTGVAPQQDRRGPAIPTGLPAGVERAIRAGLETDPSRRPPSAGALVRAAQEGAPDVLDERPPVFLMTDIVGSTRLWEEQPTTMAEALEQHDERIRAAVAGNSGTLMQSKGEGDSTVSRFGSAADALSAAADAQALLRDWDDANSLKITVRMAVHAGPVQERDGTVFGPTLNQAARLRSVAHGGQIVVSQVAADLVEELPAGLRLQTLGRHRLRDLSRTVTVFQLEGRGLPVQFPPLKTLDRLTNLPHLSDELIGREDELAVVGEMLDRARLVTLTGAGGSGKTRVALQAAAEAVDRFPGGVWLASLAPVTEGATVPRTLLEAVGGVPGAADPTHQLVDMLHREPALVVLDNCEHVLDAAAELVERLLSEVPGLTVLATSRERLRAPGEQTYAVPVLSLAAEDGDPLASPAARLFVRRAVQARSTFDVASLDPQGVSAIVEICRRLDGIPLAIELAASRVSALDPVDLAASVQDRFRLAGGGSRAALPRHTSLRAMVEWSESLLDPLARQVWRRAAVFRNGFTLDSARSVVCGARLPSDDVAALDPLDLMDGLTALVEASVVTRGEDGRYRMLETIREFGLLRLQEAGEDHAVGLRHLRLFELLTKGGPSQIADRIQRQDMLSVLRTEHDDLMAALSWGSEHAPVEMALLAVDSWLAFYLSNGMREVQMFLEAGLPHVDELPPATQALLLAFAGDGACYSGRGDVGLPWVHEGYRRAQLVDDPIIRWLSAVVHGTAVRIATGDVSLFRVRMAEAISIGDEAGLGVLSALGRLYASWQEPLEVRDQLLAWIADWLRYNEDDLVSRLAAPTIAGAQRDRASQRAMYEHLIARSEVEGFSDLWTPVYLADLCVGDGDYDEGEEMARRGIRINAGTHAGAMGVAWDLVALCAVRTGRLEEAEAALVERSRWSGIVVYAEVELALALGQPQRALRDTLRLLEINFTYVGHQCRQLVVASLTVIGLGIHLDLAAEALAWAMTVDDAEDPVLRARTVRLLQEAGGVLPPAASARSWGELAADFRSVLAEAGAGTLSVP